MSAILRALTSEDVGAPSVDEAAERVIEEIAQHIDEMTDETVAKALLALASQLVALPSPRLNQFQFAGVQVKFPVMLAR
jgi:hypothetical protein